MSKTLILDGGMGRELKRIGAPFRQPEWSALALWEAPHFVEQAHDAFVQAGARVITTNSYAVVPFHIGEQRFARDGQQLAALAGQLARRSASRAAQPVTVAGSLPPALGSYRPDLFDAEQSQAIHRVLIAGLAPHVDVWLAETQSSIAEVEAVKAALGDSDKPLWLSFTLQDDAVQDAARLRSGETVADAVAAAIRLGAAAVLFNCSQPEVMSAALQAARAVQQQQGTALALGVYANAFPPTPKDAKANATLDEIRADLGPDSYLGWAQQWVAEGAGIVGGCCGISPAHIAQLSQALA
ncbi:homocysteine S-methyltransferase family protein [Vogesella sp. DC21W]|uniref:Homocysteine S-methyltransferase family protein n=1 Tax=Vogesella aquatica TaxID=2984206 RepID=A0ABT5J190_9NEIS|nr:homocysteine S-methyltransferase family protein [Vogesella aquatica]MDC7718598.1 homocysteine S-methyltransferase family protein [Vogesella aquatica]